MMEDGMRIQITKQELDRLVREGFIMHKHIEVADEMEIEIEVVV